MFIFPKIFHNLSHSPCTADSNGILLSNWVLFQFIFVKPKISLHTVFADDTALTILISKGAGYTCLDKSDIDGQNLLYRVYVFVLLKRTMNLSLGI
jgi:hypothetical protein